MRLAILFGGASYEHEISIVSAITLKERLKERFSLSFIFCDSDHRFYLIPKEAMQAKHFASGAYKKQKQLLLTHGGFVHKHLLGTVRIEDTVLNLIHGADGEDGKIAALLEFYSIKYIGPRVDASIFSYDKRYTKWLCKAKGIGYVDYEVLYANEQKDVSFDFPLIIKPARLGSSIGVSVVKQSDALDYALDVAFEYDDAVIVEPFLPNVKEYNLAGYYASGKLHFSRIEQPQKREFLDFEKKYLDFSRTQSINEADLEEQLANRLKECFKRIYLDMFEGALIRCDFFVHDQKVYLNEINPIPGSLANYLFEDFAGALDALASSLPRTQTIRSSYDYIHKISAAKGK